MQNPQGREPRSVDGRRWIGLVAVAFAGLCLAAVALADDTWLLVDTHSYVLTVMDGERPVQRFEDISIGRGGTTRNKRKHDQKTPLGAFRISSIRPESHYHRFFGVSYPALDDAIRARDTGVISEDEFRAIRSAHEQGQEPPFSTALGGNIGIHGIGEGDVRIHGDFNWTDGCIALTNEQVDELAGWIRLGMTVVIR